VASPADAQPVARARQPMGYSLMPFLVFIVQPICLLLAIFQTLFCWIFVGLSFVLLLSMWGMQCFATRRRILISGVMVLLLLFSLAMGIARVIPKDRTYEMYGGDNAGVRAAPTQSIAAGSDPAAYEAVITAPPAAPTPTPRPNNPAFFGMASVSAPTAPIEVQSTAAPVVGTVPEPVSGGTILDSNRAYSAAETVLNGYMQMWSERNWEDMVQYTSPTWRAAQDSANHQLYWNHTGWTLLKWTIQADAQAPTAEAATLTVTATMNRNNASEDIVQQYAAILYQVDGVWYVDPDSMRGGMAVASATPAPAAADAQPGATPAAQVDPATKLWRNTKGGEYYHAEENCAEVGEKYRQYMASFEYAELDATTYKNLKRCPVCNAPARP
jgi:hypothetical protein